MINHAFITCAMFTNVHRYMLQILKCKKFFYSRLVLHLQEPLTGTSVKLTSKDGDCTGWDFFAAGCTSCSGFNQHRLFILWKQTKHEITEIRLLHLICTEQLLFTVLLSLTFCWLFLIICFSRFFLCKQRVLPLKWQVL